MRIFYLYVRNSKEAQQLAVWASRWGIPASVRPGVYGPAVRVEIIGGGGKIAAFMSSVRKEIPCGVVRQLYCCR